MDDKRYTSYGNYQNTHVIQGSWFYVQNLTTIHFFKQSNLWVTGSRQGGSFKRLSLTVVMIHNGSQEGTCTTTTADAYKTPTPQRTKLCLSAKWSLAGLHLGHMSLN